MDRELSIGQVQWHSSEEDGVPDVGILLRLSEGEELWFGELLNAEGGGHGFVLYGPGDKRRVIQRDDYDDVRELIEEHIAPAIARQSAIAELCEGLDAEFASAAQKLEVPEGHPDKPQRDFAIGVLWALQEAIHTRALLSKHSPDAPGSAGTRATESGEGDEA